MSNVYKGQPCYYAYALRLGGKDTYLYKEPVARYVYSNLNSFVRWRFGALVTVAQRQQAQEGGEGYTHTH